MRKRERLLRTIAESEHELSQLQTRTVKTLDVIKRESRLVDEIKRCREEIANIDDRENEGLLSEVRQEVAEGRRADAEEAKFWFRRFFTTLGIANAAAFAALASGLLQADHPVELAPAVAPAMDKFIWGALAAGSIPLLLWLQLILRGWIRDNSHEVVRGKAWRSLHLVARQLVIFAFVSSVYAFCWGLFIAAGSVHGLAEGKRVADTRVATESKGRVHVSPPVRE